MDLWNLMEHKTDHSVKIDVVGYKADYGVRIDIMG
jgi:hypothetical protein